MCLLFLRKLSILRAFPPDQNVSLVLIHKPFGHLQNRRNFDWLLQAIILSEYKVGKVHDGRLSFRNETLFYGSSI